MPTVNEGGCGVNVTTVRQTPLMDIESPLWQSARRGEEGGKVMVRDVPPVESDGLRSETTFEIYELEIKWCLEDENGFRSIEEGVGKKGDGGENRRGKGTLIYLLSLRLCL